MATIQMNSGNVGLYNSPYSFVSTYDKLSILDQGQMKAPDKIRNNPAQDPIVQSSENAVQGYNLLSPNPAIQDSTKSMDSNYVDYFPKIDQLRSDVKQQSVPVCGNLDSNDDDGFVDIDELLSGLQQRNPSASGTAAKSDVVAQSGSTATSTRLTEENTQGAKSETNYGSLDADLNTKSNSDSHGVTGKGPPDGDIFSASTASTVTKPTNFEICQLHPSAADLGQEQQHCDIEDESTDDLDDQDYANDSDDSPNTVERPPPSKRLRRTEEPSTMCYHDRQKDSAYSFKLSNQNKVASLSATAPQSEEIPVHGFLTLKTFESEVLYCLTFSQGSLQKPGKTQEKHDITRSRVHSRERLDSERSFPEERTLSGANKKVKFSDEDNALLLKLKAEGLSWKEIAENFPERSKETLQVHYSTKVKPRSHAPKRSKKRRRSK